MVRALLRLRFYQPADTAGRAPRDRSFIHCTTTASVSTDVVYELYLVDPGTRSSHVVTLLQEVTRRSTAECAEMVHDTPVHIASFTTRQAADDLAARFREFDAVAIVRRPGEKGLPEPAPPSAVPQPRVPVAIGMIVLGVLQLGLALLWLVQAPTAGGKELLLGIGGLVLGALATAAGVWKLRRDDLD